MDYADTIRNIWRHHDLGSATRDYVCLVRYATLAVSSHNTQPWKFRMKPGRILILSDLSRRCPEVAPDDYHLHGSLGCAAENLLWAAQAAGLEGLLSFDEAESSMRVDFEETTPSRSALFELQQVAVKMPFTVEEFFDV